MAVRKSEQKRYVLAVESTVPANNLEMKKSKPNLGAEIVRKRKSC